MKRYMPTFIQAADGAEQWAGMKEDTDGDWYSRAEVDTRIDQLERALKSTSHVLSQMLDKHSDLGDVAIQALREADTVLDVSATS